MEDLSRLTKLGSNVTAYKYDEPKKEMLEIFENKKQERPYLIELVCPEFTSLCPKTGQPDFATITIKYSPKKHCIETKSLKLYLFSYRNSGAFMESITNKILDDLVDICKPRSMEVVGDFNARGGITLKVRATYHDPSMFASEDRTK